jgi:hypothetical protein
MAGKQGAKKVAATKTPKRRLANAVRLDLSDKDYQRLDRVTEFKGLNKASYSRMAVLERLRKDEEEMGP